MEFSRASLRCSKRRLNARIKIQSRRTCSSYTGEELAGTHIISISNNLTLKMKLNTYVYMYIYRYRQKRVPFSERPPLVQMSGYHRNTTLSIRLLVLSRKATITTNTTNGGKLFPVCNSFVFCADHVFQREAFPICIFFPCFCRPCVPTGSLRVHASSRSVKDALPVGMAVQAPGYSRRSCSRVGTLSYGGAFHLGASSPAPFAIWTTVWNLFDRVMNG